MVPIKKYMVVLVLGIIIIVEIFLSVHRRN